MDRPGIPLFACVTVALAVVDAASAPRLAAVDAVSAPPLVAQADSAGIPIITARAPLWDPGEGWKISDEPLVEIGSLSGVPEHQLAGVVGVVRLSDGEIVIAESTTGELRRYDQSGGLVWRAGGAGQGPGEHKYLGFMSSLPGDSLLTADADLLRVNVFAPSGRVARTVRLEMPGPGLAPRFPAFVVGVSERHLVMAFEDRREEPSRLGVGRWPGVRLAMLSLDDGRIGSWIDAPGREASLARRAGRVQNAAYVFGKEPKYAVSGGLLALADTDRFSVRFIALDGGSTQWILRRDEPAREVTSDHVDAWVDWAVTISRHPGGPSAIMRAARETPMAPTLPVLESLYLDAVGNLWVEPYSLFAAPMPPFEVYAPDGSWLGSVAVPPGLGDERQVWFGFGRKFEIGDDYILGVWHDELDVEHVRLYGLEKAGPP